MWVHDQFYYPAILFFKILMPVHLGQHLLQNPRRGQSVWVTKLTLTCSKSIIKTLKKVRDMFKVNNKNSRAMSLTSLLYFYCELWTCFVTFPSVFFVEFEQVNINWEEPWEELIHGWKSFSKTSSNLNFSPQRNLSFGYSIMLYIFCVKLGTFSFHMILKVWPLTTKPLLKNTQT